MKRPNHTVQLNEAHISPLATRTAARRVVRDLVRKGWNALYHADLSTAESCFISLGQYQEFQLDFVDVLTPLFTGADLNAFIDDEAEEDDEGEPDGEGAGEWAWAKGWDWKTGLNTLAEHPVGPPLTPAPHPPLIESS